MSPLGHHIKFEKLWSLKVKKKKTATSHLCEKKRRQLEPYKPNLIPPLSKE
jgi:hypothetical protein